MNLLFAESSDSPVVVSLVFIGNKHIGFAPAGLFFANLDNSLSLSFAHSLMLETFPRVTSCDLPLKAF